MPVWRTTPVGHAPELTMCSWMLIRTERDEVHVVGYNTTEGAGRVSSPVVSLDLAARVAVTRSGRRYVLRGTPGQNPDALFVFAAWCRAMQVVQWSDVTDEILEHGLPCPGGRVPHAARQLRDEA